MGYTLSLERRLRLLDWASRNGTYILEDDYDSDFRYRGSPLTALMGLDRHGSVIYLGTFSKSMGAGLRLGYMIVPPQLVEAARTVKALLDNGHPWLEQAAMAEFLAGGSYANHLRRIRQLYRERRDCLIEVLRAHFGEVELSGQDSGMHVTWHLPRGYPAAAEVQRLAAGQGVGVYCLQGGAAYDFDGCAYSSRAIMLGYSSLDERQIGEGIRRVAALLQPPRHAGGVRAAGSFSGGDFALSRGAAA
jgi:GntR family transcriptional regulator/MocR family aminotransferase